MSTSTYTLHIWLLFFLHVAWFISHFKAWFLGFLGYHDDWNLFEIQNVFLPLIKEPIKLNKRNNLTNQLMNQKKKSQKTNTLNNKNEVNFFTMEPTEKSKNLIISLKSPDSSCPEK